MGPHACQRLQLQPLTSPPAIALGKPGCSFYNLHLQLQEKTMMLSHWTKHQDEAKAQTSGVREVQMPDGTVRFMYRQEGDRDRALKALEALKKATKNDKPHPHDGGAAAIRALRDGR